MAGAESHRPDFAEHFIEGVNHFNAGRYWEAHESWEALWLVARPGSRQFLQGLIQLAAAYLHLGRGNFSGASRLFVAGLEKLEGSPASCLTGLDARFVARAKSDRDELERAISSSAPPRLERSAPAIALMDGWIHHFAGDQW